MCHMIFSLKQVDIVMWVNILENQVNYKSKQATFTHTHKRNPSIMQKKTIKPQKKKETKNYKITEKQSLKWK